MDLTFSHLPSPGILRQGGRLVGRVGQHTSIRFMLPAKLPLPSLAFIHGRLKQAP